MTSLVLWTSIKNCIVRLMCFLFKRDVFSFFVFFMFVARSYARARLIMWPTTCGHIMKRCGCLSVRLSVCHVSYLENGAR